MNRSRAALTAAVLVAVSLAVPATAAASRREGDAEVTTQEPSPGITAEAFFGSGGSGPSQSSAAGDLQAGEGGSTPAGSASGSETSSVVAALTSGWVFEPLPCIDKSKQWNFQLPACGSSRGPRNRRRGGGRPQPPTPEELGRIAADRAMSLAPNPVLELAPSAVGLTGLNSYFWLAQEPSPIEATASVPGLTVVAQARPTQFVWSFGDGSDLVTEHSGRPWTSRHLGDISHLYEVRGHYSVGVEVIWEARWRLGNGPWISLGFFSNSDSEAYPVRQVVSRLVPAF